MQTVTDDPIYDASKTKRTKYLATATDVKKVRLETIDLIDSMRSYNRSVSNLVDYGFTLPTIELWFDAKYLNIYDEINQMYKGLNLSYSGGKSVGEVPYLDAAQIEQLINAIFGVAQGGATRSELVLQIITRMRNSRVTINAEGERLNTVLVNFRNIGFSNSLIIAFIKQLTSSTTSLVNYPDGSAVAISRTPNSGFENIEPFIKLLATDEDNKSLMTGILNAISTDPTEMNRIIQKAKDEKGPVNFVDRITAIILDLSISGTNNQILMYIRNRIKEYLKTIVSRQDPNHYSRKWVFDNITTVEKGEAIKKPPGQIEDRTYVSIVNIYKLTTEQEKLLFNIISKLSTKNQTLKQKLTDDQFFDRVNNIFSQMIDIILKRDIATASNDPAPKNTIMKQRRGYFTTVFNWITSIGFNDIFQIVTNPTYTRETLENIINNLLTNNPIEKPIKPPREEKTIQPDDIKPEKPPKQQVEEKDPLIPIDPTIPIEVKSPDVQPAVEPVIQPAEQPTAVDSSTLSDNSFFNVPLTEQDEIDLNTLREGAIQDDFPVSTSINVSRAVDNIIKRALDSSMIKYIDRINNISRETKILTDTLRQINEGTSNDDEKIISDIQLLKESYEQPPPQSAQQPSRIRQGITKIRGRLQNQNIDEMKVISTRQVEPLPTSIRQVQPPSTRQIQQPSTSQETKILTDTLRQINEGTSNDDEKAISDIQLLRNTYEPPSRIRQGVDNSMTELKKKLQNVMNELRKKYKKFSLGRTVRIKIKNISRTHLTMEDAIQWLITNGHATDAQTAQQYLNYEYGMIRDYTEEDKDKYEDIPLDELEDELIEVDDYVPWGTPPDDGGDDPGGGDPSGGRGGRGRRRRPVPPRPQVFNGLSRRQWLLLLLIIVLLSTGVISLDDVFKKGGSIDDTGKTSPPSGGGTGGGGTGGGAGGTGGTSTGGKVGNKWVKFDDSDFYESVGLGEPISIYNDMVDKYNSLPASQQKAYDNELAKYYDALSKATNTPTLGELKTARATYDDLKKQYDNALSKGLSYDLISGIYFSLRNSINFLNTMTTKYVDMENGIFSFLNPRTKDSPDITIDDVDTDVTIQSTQSKGSKGKGIVDSSFALMSKGMKERILRKLENRSDSNNGILAENQEFINFSLMPPNGGLGSIVTNPLVLQNKRYERMQYLNANKAPQPYIVPSKQQIIKNTKYPQPRLYNVIQIDDTMNYDAGNLLINQKLYNQTPTPSEFDYSRLYNPEYRLEKLNRKVKNIQNDNDLIGRSGAYYGLPKTTNQYYQYGNVQLQQNEELNNYPNTTMIKMTHPLNIKSRRNLPNSYSKK